MLEMLQYNDGSTLSHEENQRLKKVLDNRGYIKEFFLDYTYTMTLISGYNVNIRFKSSNGGVSLKPSNRLRKK